MQDRSGLIHVTTQTMRAGGIVLRGRLGADRLGVVCWGHDEKADRSVALRLLHVDTAVPEFTKHARRLGAVLQSLSSENPVAQFTSIEQLELGTRVEGSAIGCVPVIVSPLFARGSLHDRMPTWSTHDLLQQLRPIAAAIDELHGLGVLHGDVRIERVVWSRGDSLVLVDTGIATLARDLRRDERDPYLTPQLQAGGALDENADRYAFSTLVAVALGRLEQKLTGEQQAVLRTSRLADPSMRPTSSAELIEDLLAETPAGVVETEGGQPS